MEQTFAPHVSIANDGFHGRKFLFCASNIDSVFQRPSQNVGTSFEQLSQNRYFGT